MSARAKSWAIKARSELMATLGAACANEMNGFPEYSGRSRFPKKQPAGFCRGCRLPIDPTLEPRAQTWHRACKKKFDPLHVKQDVRKRADDKCEKCGRDCSRNARRLYHASGCFYPPTYAECGLPYPYDAVAYYAHPLYVTYRTKYQKWKREEPTPEFDHIIPHCEGGLFTVDNIRLLCRACHLKRTAEWRQSAKAKP